MLGNAGCLFLHMKYGKYYVYFYYFYARCCTHCSSLRIVLGIGMSSFCLDVCDKLTAKQSVCHIVLQIVLQ